MKKALLVLLFAACLLAGGGLAAQMPGGEPVRLGNQTQTLNGRCYYIHIVQRGQTVYAITRAYGMKENDAYVKKDIHFLSIGDTVWLPCQLRTVFSQPDDASPDKAPDNRSAITEPPSYQSPVADVVAPPPADTVRRPKVTVVREAPSQPPYQGVDSAVIRPRNDNARIVVSLMMPLFLDQIDNISTTKFDIEQRGKMTYKSFEFIQFYEGILMGLQQLEEQGVNVTLNVVDVPDDNPKTVESLFESHNVAESDFVIALLTRKPFAKAAELAKRNNIMIVNPISTRSEIVETNPYVFKCEPSDRSKIAQALDYVQAVYPDANLVVVHSGGQSDKALLQMAKQLLEERKYGDYSVVNWSENTKIKDVPSRGPTVVLNLYRLENQSKTRIAVSTMLNKLSANKSNPAILITLDDWSTLYGDIDYSQLQQLSYHTYYCGWDYGNADHIDFLERFREKYKTEPIDQYAAMGNDIIMYFVMGLQHNGVSFWREPNQRPLKGMLKTFSFEQANPFAGFENASPMLYRMEKYVFQPVR